MKKNTLLLLAMVTSAGILHAQTPNIVSEPWNEKPVLTVLDPIKTITWPNIIRCTKRYILMTTGG